MGLAPKVRKFFGHALNTAQHGDRHVAVKVLRGFGGAGVGEVIEDDASGTYRGVYTITFTQTEFVLHGFEKKSKSGISTPKEHIDLIRARLRAAEALAKELEHGKAQD